MNTTEITVAKTWLQAHERLIITVLVLLALVFGVNKFIDRQAAHDTIVAAQAALTLKAQEAKDAELAQAAAAQQQQYIALVQQLTAQNSALAAQQNQRTVVYQQQVKADAGLSMPDLGARLSHLLALGATDVTSTTSGLTLSPNASYRATESLEQVPVLQANLADEQSKTTNLTKELSASDALNKTKDSQITNLKQTVTDTQVAGDTKLAACQATARRGKLHSFLYGAGVGAGVVAGVVIHALI